MDDLCVCFDFDGTLIDSRHGISIAVNRVRRSFDLNEISDKRVVESIGSGTRELVEGTFPAEVLDGNVEELIENFREAYFEVCAESVQPYDKIPSLISELSGGKRSIVTNKPLSMTEKILITLEWSDYFDPVFGPNSFDRRKPDPRPLRAVLEQWGVDPGDLVMVGDSWTDVRAGNQIGCRTVACLYGFGKTDETLAESPDETVESVGELRELLRGLSGRTNE